MATTARGTTRTSPADRTNAMRLPRTTGALSGLLIMLLGIWGGLIPFVGPYFHYAFGGYHTWHYTSQRLWLEIVPGAVAVIGGLMLMRATTRVGGLTAGWVALAAGVWFAIGPSVSLLWHHTIYAIGIPAGGHWRQMLEWVGYFYGLGAVIIGLAAFAMGRYFSRPRIVEEPVVAAEAAGAAVADRHAADRRPADEPVGRRTVAEEPVADRRVAEEPVADRRVADEPVADRPATDAPVEDRPATDAPVSDRAASDAPVADRAAYDQPAGAAPAASPAAGAQATSYRRRPGLLRRLRGH